ncbi:hypothetical protein BV25DRAFT_203112 [Artomyces pyxidatus]|uniref:Uncharacterized protein n=1 Tax=Artomyces pyxidatus TaxID=48021 RepID=A0ACB8TA28_9AGAM|nr:hypothetical protein BV25DRAFT_203112 [Artomyces pyxidatus]
MALIVSKVPAEVSNVKVRVCFQQPRLCSFITEYGARRKTSNGFPDSIRSFSPKQDPLSTREMSKGISSPRRCCCKNSGAYVVMHSENVLSKAKGTLEVWMNEMEKESGDVLTRRSQHRLLRAKFKRDSPKSRVEDSAPNVVDSGNYDKSCT